jgi:hypothetical protein
MNDDELTTTWTVFAPTPDEHRRIDRRVSAWLAASDTSLVGEWLTLIKVSPVGTFAMATVSALALVVFSPLVWLLRAVVDAF